jgi:hypothetical protein
LSVVFSATAYADDGTWNAGMSQRLPNATGGNDGRSNAGMSNNLPNGTGGNSGVSQYLPNGTGGSAMSQSRGR